MYVIFKYFFYKKYFDAKVHQLQCSFPVHFSSVPNVLPYTSKWQVLNLFFKSLKKKELIEDCLHTSHNCIGAPLTGNSMEHLLNIVQSLVHVLSIVLFASIQLNIILIEIYAFHLFFHVYFLRHSLI